MVRMRFAGRDYDAETGLYFMRARYYDPAVGRFISEDPIGIGGGMNLYAYAGSDPINLRDPFGLDPCNPDDPKCKPHKLPENGGLGTPPFPPPMDDPVERREAFEAHEYGHLRPEQAPEPIWAGCGSQIANFAFDAVFDGIKIYLTIQSAGLATQAGGLAIKALAHQTAGRLIARQVASNQAIALTKRSVAMSSAAFGVETTGEVISIGRDIATQDAAGVGLWLLDKAVSRVVDKPFSLGIFKSGAELLACLRK